MARFIEGNRILAANKVGGRRPGEVVLLAAPAGYLTGFISKADVGVQLPRHYSDFVAAGENFQRRSQRGF